MISVASNFKIDWQIELFEETRLTFHRQAEYWQRHPWRYQFLNPGRFSVLALFRLAIDHEAIFKILPAPRV